MPQSRKTLLNIIIIILTLILSVYFYLTGSITIYFGKAGYYVNTDSKLEDIDGELLIAPFFSDKDYLNIFKETQKILFAQIYNITDKNTINMLKLLALQGVEIKIITEDQQYATNGTSWQKFLQNFAAYPQIQIKTDKQMGTKYVHTKIFIFDKKFIIQTANLTYSLFFKNREYVFISSNQNIRKNLLEIFQSDWSGNKTNSDQIHPNLLVCNINCRAKIEYYLNNARRSIYIQTQSIEDKQIISILQAKQNLDLKIQVADTDANKDLFTIFNIENIKKFNKYYLHAKSILIDKEILIIGSINLTTNSLDNNREISIVLINPKIIQKYLNNFQQDWNNNLKKNK